MCSFKWTANVSVLSTGTHGLLYYAVLTDDVTGDAEQGGLLVKTVTGSEQFVTPRAEIEP